MVPHAGDLREPARLPRRHGEPERRAERERLADEDPRRLAADPGDVAVDARQQLAQRVHLLAREVGERRGVEDAHERARGRRLDHAGEEGERVTAADVDRPVRVRDRQRRVEARVPRRLVRPQTSAEPAHVGGVVEVEGGEVDPGAPRHRRRVERRRAPAPQLARDPQRRPGIPHDPSCVLIAVVVPQPVESRARADLDLRERPPARHRRERGEQPGAARDLVGLRAAGGERGGQPLLARRAEAHQRGAERAVGRPRAAGGRVVGGELVVGLAQQLVVDRGEEHHRRLLRRPHRERQQLRRLGHQLADARVERRVVAHRLDAEAPEPLGQPGRVHGLAR